MSKSELSATKDAPYWADLNQILIDGRPFTLEGRTYQLEMMRYVTDDGKVKHNEVIRKGSQTGATIGKSIEICHGAIHDLYPQGIIYYFPSKGAVESFSGSRFKPLLKDNEFIAKYCNDMNAVSVRRIGRVNVNFFGCSGTTIIGGEAKDSTSVRSTPADWVLLDERDLFDDEMAAQVNQRLGNSTISRRSDMGTPKLPDDGIDRLYKRSDMRRWQIKCDYCRKFTCLETEFPQCIKLDDDGRGYPACVHCGRLIDRTHGSWEMDSPSKGTVGYWCSQLLNPNRDLAHVLKEYDDPEQFDTTEAEFQRIVLGKAYARAEDKLKEAEVYQCCTPDQMPYSHPGPCAMGFDVGNTIHGIIGHRVGNDRYRIVKLFRVTDWNALHDLAQRFNVKSTVGDAMPESHKIKEWAQQEAGYGNTVYPCFYTEHLKTFDSWSIDNVVKVNRTEIFDESHHMVISPGKLLLPRNCEEVKIFAHQLCMAAKFLETDKKSGARVYRYKKIGDKNDHYRNALNYFRLACKKVGLPQNVIKKRKTQTQDMRYSL